MPLRFGLVVFAKIAFQCSAPYFHTKSCDRDRDEEFQFSEFQLSSIRSYIVQLNLIHLAQRLNNMTGTTEPRIHKYSEQSAVKFPDYTIRK